MQDSNANRKNNQRADRRLIDRWETIRTIVDERSDRGNLPLKLIVSIERPVFTNGDVGYQRVNAIITVGNYYVRLATRAIIDLLDILAEHRGKIMNAVNDTRDANDESDREKRKAANSKNNGHTKPKDRIPVAKGDLPILDDATLNRSRGRHKTTRTHGRPSDRRQR